MKQTSRALALVVSVLILAGSIGAFVKRQDIYDALALRGYTPNERIVGLATDTTMQDRTRRVFYVNHPELNSKEDFRANCPATEQSIVLGCYIQNHGIHLLDVTDERLNGVIQVTAAHEVLHAEYDRLSKDERARIDGLTSSFFATLDNKRIKDTVEQYRAKDPGVVPNELHSILATEVRNLSPELEQYYSRYFKDRGQIVSFSEKYEDTFVKLTDQVNSYDETLNRLKKTIESSQQEIDGQNKDIEQQKARLDNLLSSGNTQGYNDSVSSYNITVNRYNALIGSTRSLISEYNDIVEKRNAIATTEQELVEAINSNVIPTESQ